MTAPTLLLQDATAMADAVRANSVSAVALVQASLDRIAATNGRINSLTDVVRERALRRAAQVDAFLASPNGDRTRELPLLGVLGGYFRQRVQPEAGGAVDRVAEALGASQTVVLPMVDAGRAAALLITNSEGAALHLSDLRKRPQDFEPLSRDRFLEGALLPAAWVAPAARARPRCVRYSDSAWWLHM